MCRLKLLLNGNIDTNAITNYTKLIILNSPYNPMGTVISKNKFKEITKIAKDKDLPVISDEVYEHTCWREIYKCYTNIGATS